MASIRDEISAIVCVVNTHYSGLYIRDEISGMEYILEHVSPTSSIKDEDVNDEFQWST